MSLTRRTTLLWGGLLAILGIGAYEARPELRPLETDPDRETFEYRDGVIRRIES